jgi:hypothetical protein
MTAFPDAEEFPMAKRFLAVPLVMALFSVFALAQAGDQPLKRAKVGDYAVFKSSGQGFQMIMKNEVVGVKGNEVTIKYTSTVNGMDLPASEQKFDVSTKYNPADAQKNKDLKVVETGSGKETLKIDGKEYQCEWRTNSVTGSVNGIAVDTQSKWWVSKDAPVHGLVKTETRVMGQVLTMELIEAGSKK